MSYQQEVVGGYFLLARHVHRLASSPLQRCRTALRVRDSPFVSYHANKNPDIGLYVRTYGRTDVQPRKHSLVLFCSKANKYAIYYASHCVIYSQFFPKNYFCRHVACSRDI